MLVVVFNTRPGTRTRTLPNGMGIIKSQQSLIIAIVKRQGILQAMRFLR